MRRPSPEARRLLGRWLISTWLERGMVVSTSVDSRLPRPISVERVLSPRELARLVGRPLRLRVLPVGRR